MIELDDADPGPVREEPSETSKGRDRRHQAHEREEALSITSHVLVPPCVIVFRRARCAKSITLLMSPSTYFGITIAHSPTMCPPHHAHACSISSRAVVASVFSSRNANGVRSSSPRVDAKGRDTTPLELCRLARSDPAQRLRRNAGLEDESPLGTHALRPLDRAPHSFRAAPRVASARRINDLMSPST